MNHHYNPHNSFLWLLLLSFFLLCSGYSSWKVDFADAYDNGLGRLPVLGWNTWCAYGMCAKDYCDETQIKETAQAMIDNGMHDLGYNYINLDDCWAWYERDGQGELQGDPNRFPNGMADLADWLHQKGFKFGLYTSAGSETCNRGHRKHDIPGSYGHYELDAQTFAKWKIDYVKLDWCGHHCNDAIGQHTNFSKALNATGHPMWLELCRGYDFPPPAYVIDVAQSWRIGNDMHDHFYSVQKLLPLFRNGTWRGGPYGWNYGDFLMTGGEGCPLLPLLKCPGMNEHEYMTQFALWAVLGSPLIVATDVRKMSASMKKILLNDELIAVNQDLSYQVGDFIGYGMCNHTGSTNPCQIWTRPLQDGSVAVVLYNDAKLVHDFTFDFTTLGWSSSTVVSIRDIWEHQDLGKFTGSFKQIIPSHGNAALILKKL